MRVVCLWPLRWPLCAHGGAGECTRKLPGWIQTSVCRRYEEEEQKEYVDDEYGDDGNNDGDNDENNRNKHCWHKGGRH